ncbi:MAG: hypothetical protein KKC84_00700 [Candidatus Omnitrophica bacterium]|nr:hypothetical protein [Candidatus Omnitrophota bacterium]
MRISHYRNASFTFLVLVCSLFLTASEGASVQEEDAGQIFLNQAFQSYIKKEYAPAADLFKKAAQAVESPRLKRKAVLWAKVTRLLSAAERLPAEAARKKIFYAERLKWIATKTEVSFLYKDARRYYRHKEFQKAKEAFNQIFALDSLQSKARLYVEEKLPLAIRQQEVKATYRRACDFFVQEEYARALDACILVLADYSLHREARDCFTRIIPQSRRKERIKSLYQEARRSFSNRDFERAAQLYAEILEWDPAQEEAQEYLTHSISLEPLQKKPEVPHTLGLEETMESLQETRSALEEKHRYSQKKVWTDRCAEMGLGRIRKKRQLSVSRRIDEGR